MLFDEFHERSIHTDTALAFLRETVGALRPDLRIVVMSATLNAETLAARLRTDAVVKVEAERHPVTVSYRPPEPGRGSHRRGGHRRCRRSRLGCTRR